jgi:ubiquitin-conjugating enzyme E2 D/E
MATGRISRDLAGFESNPLEGVAIEVVGNDIFHVKATIQGPAGTPYEGGTFLVDIRFPSDYPLRSPDYHFVTKIYHPNVVFAVEDGIDRGKICKPKWTPKDSLSTIVEYLCSLIAAPDLDNALNGDVAAKYKSSKPEFDRIATEWTRRYATGR